MTLKISSIYKFYTLLPKARATTTLTTTTITTTIQQKQTLQQQQHHQQQQQQQQHIYKKKPQKLLILMTSDFRYFKFPYLKRIYIKRGLKEVRSRRTSYLYLHLLILSKNQIKFPRQY